MYISWTAEQLKYLSWQLKDVSKSEGLVLLSAMANHHGKGIS